jgi:hypothetical protein
LSLLIETFEIQAIVAPPQEMQGLLELVETRSAYQCDSLKEIRVPAGRSSSAFIRRVQSRLCRNVVLEYGSPEAGIHRVGKLRCHRGCTQRRGLVMPGVKVEIVNEAGKALPVGDEGIVRARSNYLPRSLQPIIPTRPPTLTTFGATLATWPHRPKRHPVDRQSGRWRPSSGIEEVGDGITHERWDEAGLPGSCN